MLQDIKILKKKANFLDITSLNTFMKNTTILQKHMAIPDYKKEEKVMWQNTNISKNSTDFLDMTYVKTVIKKYKQKRTCIYVARYQNIEKERKFS